MKAIILAAGRGSRLKHLTDQQPKCLLEVRGKSLLSRQVESLSGADIKDIAVVTGYCCDKVKHPGITRYFHNPSWSSTNMVYSLTMADEWLSQSDCMVSYADIFYEPSAVVSLLQSAGDIVLTYDVNFLELWRARYANPLDDLEQFIIKDGVIQKIGGKPLSVDEVMGQYMGLLKINHLAWPKIKSFLVQYPRFDQLDMTGLLNVLLANQFEIRGVPYSGSWGEVDYESDLSLYNMPIMQIKS